MSPRLTTSTFNFNTSRFIFIGRSTIFTVCFIIRSRINPISRAVSTSGSGSLRLQQGFPLWMHGQTGEASHPSTSLTDCVLLVIFQNAENFGSTANSFNVNFTQQKKDYVFFRSFALCSFMICSNLERASVIMTFAWSSSPIE